MARSLNRVQLIGNLTRDVELRYTPQGTAVCSFGIATNRTWTTDTGEKKDEADFHKIVAWNKLAELCSQFLSKGKKVYVEGRLSTRSWNAQDGTQKSSTEVIISDMILLDNSGRTSQKSSEGEVVTEEAPKESKSKKSEVKKDKTEEGGAEEEMPHEEAGAKEGEVAPDDIPF
jgi:single-strand DNA-binding protein